MNKTLAEALDEMAEANIALIKALSKSLDVIIEQQVNIKKANEQINSLLQKKGDNDGDAWETFFGKSKPAVSDRQR